MDRLVEIVNHRSEWAALFDNEAAKLRPIFGAQFVAAHHVGSTSIPDLKAKPIIDILLEVADINQVANFNQEMEKLGYEVMGEYGLPRRRYFRKDTDGLRTHHVHTWQSGDPEIKRHLAFRDYLISHPSHAESYGNLKIDLVRRYAGNREHYIEGKAAFCKQIEKEALAWQEEVDSYAMENNRLRLIPLSAAQLYFILNRPDQLEAALGLPISRAVIAPPVVIHAIRVKKQRLLNTPPNEFPWHTYWLVAILSEPFGAGLIGFKGYPDTKGEVEIGYGIDPHWRNQGYTTAAAKLLIDWAFEQDYCLAVTAWSDKANVASARVLQKVGMKLGHETEDQYCWLVNAPKEGS